MNNETKIFMRFMKEHKILFQYLKLAEIKDIKDLMKIIKMQHIFAISSFFSWVTTKQGETYWFNLETKWQILAFNKKLFNQVIVNDELKQRGDNLYKKLMNNEINIDTIYEN